MSSLFDVALPLLMVRFEQGRGRGGVPRTWMAVLDRTTIETVVRQAVQLLRAGCADQESGHGRDLMPGADGEYFLHNVDGGVIEKVEDIRWETRDGQRRAEVVLTWGLPSERLARSSLKAE